MIDQTGYDVINMSGMRAPSLYSCIRGDDGPRSILVECQKRERASLSVCLDMPEEEFEIISAARAGCICYVWNFKTPPLSQIVRTLSVRPHYWFY